MGVVVFACGGRTVDDGSHGAAGGVSAGGASAGGASAGGASAGGASAGGTSAGGTSAGGVSAGGAGGTVVAGSGGVLVDGGEDAGPGGSEAGGSGGTGTADSGTDGDGGSVLPSCGSLPVSLIQACIENVTKPVNTPWPTLAASGPVLATGPAPKYGACPQGFPMAADAFWFELKASDGDTWRVTVSLPGFGNPLTPGQVVSVDASFHYGGPFAPTRAAVTIRDPAGKLLGYVGHDAALQYLKLPAELEVKQGAKACTTDEYCGDWSAYDFSVVLGGAQHTLEPWKTKTIGSYVITHGGCEVQEPNTGGSCADWWVSHVALGLRPAP